MLRLYFWLTMLAYTMLAIMILVLSSTVRAHSWYDAECCSSQDCEPLSPDQVRVEGDDYVLPTGQRVPMNKARRSRDRDFHWCRTLGSPRTFIEPAGKLQCFYAPQGDM